MLSADTREGPAMNANSSVTIRRRLGFTLVELLTVIGIIILLIGILLPVVAAVRKSAAKADSQQLITNLASAIERYRADFAAYPGPIPNGAYNASGVAPTFGGTTATENMVFGIVGGWEPGTMPPVSSNFPNDTADNRPPTIGQGPMSHNPVVTARRRVPAYYDIDLGGNMWRKNAAGNFDPYNPTFATPAPWGAPDSGAPEFVDKFPEPLPILYLRANVGTGGVVSMNNTTNYNASHLEPYRRPPVPGFKGDFVFDNTDPDHFPTMVDYFRNPAVGTPNMPATYQARQKDGFWLIGAGPDRRFGTKDDQTNFGSF